MIQPWTSPRQACLAGGGPTGPPGQHCRVGSRSDPTLAEAGSSVLGERLVRVAVQPPLTRLRRRNDRVAAGARVLGGVPLRRVVAAARRPALLAGAEMDPGGADLHALLALVARCLLDRADRGEVRAALLRHHPTAERASAASGQERPRRRRCRRRPPPRLLRR